MNLNVIKHSVVFALLVCSSIQLKAQLKVDEVKPNVVFILVDDLGWMDLGVQGSTFYQTPRVDELASNGLRFTDAYAANPVCSPTRASIMSGKDPADVSVNISNWIGAQLYEKRTNQALIQPGVGDHLPLEEITMAEAFQQQGYTTQFIGKWHLGETEEFWPEKQGFDDNIAGWSRGNPGSFFAPYNNPRISDGPDGEYLPYRLGNEAVSFIEHSAKEKDPFFLFLSMYNVHTPIEAPKDLVARFEKRRDQLKLSKKGAYKLDEGVESRTNQSDATYAAMIWAMDSVVGMVQDKLDELNLTKETAIVFFSDNGGLSSPGYGVTSNLPLRGGKGFLYEGGIREPLIIRYDPLTSSHKGSVVAEPVISHDFYPTLLDIANLEKPKNQELEGVSLKPLLSQKDLARESIFWHYPHYSPQKGKPGSAIRKGDYKLIHFYENNVDELYNLKEDIGETNNIAKEHPQLVKELNYELFEHLEKINASYPVKRPIKVD
ncbi:sulfatase [Leeuwenhoekiella sp. NPDC079379]|uniref:sulfatase n=1 Tax=Leeuwenhoekiella sp. NPDC079379 TaxID=3364122 RepID=UPI0037C7B1CE